VSRQDVARRAPRPGRPAAGHRLLPHTADVRLLAWAPSAPECLDEAVRALADVFVAVPDDAARVSVPVALPAGVGGEMLVSLLEEALFVVDVRGLVPVGARLALEPAGIRGEFATVALADVEQVGSVPKAIARSDLVFGEDGDGVWHAVVTVDV